MFSWKLDNSDNMLYQFWAFNYIYLFNDWLYYFSEFYKSTPIPSTWSLWYCYSERCSLGYCHSHQLDKSDSGPAILSLSLTTPWRWVFEIFTARRRTLPNCFFPGFSPEDQPAHISNESITTIPTVFHHNFYIFFWESSYAWTYSNSVSLKVSSLENEFGVLYSMASFPTPGKNLWAQALVLGEVIMVHLSLRARFSVDWVATVQGLLGLLLLA